MHSPILAPLVALILWSFVMLAWLYATRFHGQLPAQVRWKADNYNNLMEQPTLFYAVTLAFALLGEGTSINTRLAWIYVVLRIAHSLVQAIRYARR